jgi:hypothetical protein
MAQRKAKTEVEALLRSEGAPPELLASKLDALDPDTRAALCRNKDNVIAVGARLAEARARAIQHGAPLLRRCRASRRLAAAPAGPRRCTWRARLLASRAEAAPARSDTRRRFPPFLHRRPPRKAA